MDKDTFIGSIGLGISLGVILGDFVDIKILDNFTNIYYIPILLGIPGLAMGLGIKFLTNDESSKLLGRRFINFSTGMIVLTIISFFFFSMFNFLQKKDTLEGKILEISIMKRKLNSQLINLEEGEETYRTRVKVLISEINVEKRMYNISSLSNANDRINYNMKLIQNADAYLTEVLRLKRSTKSGIEESVFLERMLEDKQTMKDLIGTSKVLGKDIDSLLKNYNPYTEKIAINPENLRLKSLEEIWKQVEETPKTTKSKDNSKNQLIESKVIDISYTEALIKKMEGKWKEIKRSESSSNLGIKDIRLMETWSSLIEEQKKAFIDEAKETGNWGYHADLFGRLSKLDGSFYRVIKRFNNGKSNQKMDRNELEILIKDWEEKLNEIKRKESITNLGIEDIRLINSLSRIISSKAFDLYDEIIDIDEEKDSIDLFNRIYSLYDAFLEITMRY